MSKMISNDFTPDKKENISLSSINDFFTPSKLSNDFFDSSHLSEFEAVKMLHDTDIISNFNNLQLPQNSNLNISSQDEYLNNQEPVENFSSDYKKNCKTRRKSVTKTIKKSYNSKSRLSTNTFKVVSRKNSPRKCTSRNYTSENCSASDENTEDETENVLGELYDVESREILPSKTIEELEKLEIKLIHVVPPQHKVEHTAGTTSITSEEKEKFERFIEIKKGNFTKEEDDIIKTNWKSFCEIHDWNEKNVQPFLRMRHQGTILISSFTERQKFVQFLANGLPSRCLCSVYSRFKYLFTSFSSIGRYSSEEDKKIIAFVNSSEKSSGQFAELAKILGRTRHSIHKRYTLLKRTYTVNSKKVRKRKSTDKINVFWSLDLMEEFLNELLNATLSEDIMELKNAVIPSVVWDEVARNMQIPRNVLYKFWFQRMHLQLFSPDPIYLNDVKIKLIEYLYTSGISDQREINWTEATDLFDGMTTPFICKIVFQLFFQIKQKNICENFEEILSYLYEEMMPYFKTRPKDKYLPRFSYENNRLKILDEIEEFESNESVSEELKSSRRKSVKFTAPRKRKIKYEENCDWTLLKREKFLKALLDVTICENIHELKDAVIPAVVWKKMEKLLKIKQNSLQNLWYKELHLQLFSPNQIYINDVKIKLIELIYWKDFKLQEQIDWDKICAYFDGMTTDFLSEIFDDLVKFASKKIISTDFRETLSYLYEKMIPYLEKNSTDKYLPRLSYDDKKLRVLGEIEDGESKGLLEKELKLPKRRSVKFVDEIKSENEEDCDIVWTLERRDEFLKTLLNVTISENIYELKDAIIPMVVWQEMEKQLKVDQNTLQNLWFKELHLQLFSPSPIYINDIKIKLIELIYWKNLKMNEEIDFEKISSYFDGVTAVFISEIFNNLVEIVSKEINSNEFCEILNYLYENMIPYLKSNPTDKCLPRLSFDNNELKVLDEIEEDKSEGFLKKELKSKAKSINSNDKNVDEEKENCEIVWKLEKRERFLNILLDVMICEDIQELKDAVIPDVVWEKVRDILKVDQNTLEDFWYNELHLQLFSPKPIYMNDLKMKLIELIYWKKFKTQEEINWDKICKYFDGTTSVFLSRLFSDLVKFASKKIESTKFCDVTEYLFKRTFPSLKNMDVDKFLPRITFRNQKIQVIDDDCQNSEIDGRDDKSSDENENER